MKNQRFSLIIFILICICGGNLNHIEAQTSSELIKEMMEEDRSTIDALVMYPAETRKDLFVMSTHPELIIRMKSLQEKTKSKFKDVIADMDQDDQEKFYNLMRFPDLNDAITKGGKKSKTELAEILEDYPEEIHEDAKFLNKKKFDELEEINKLNNSVRGAFEEMISSYPAESQDAARNLVKMPETISLLSESIDMTLVIGDLYKKNPEWVVQKADSLNLEVARQHAEELADYEEQLKADPDAYEEMLEAAEQYAKDNQIEEYDDVYYEGDVYEDPTVRVTYHYSYWYGYPYWYTHPFWAPYPWYYHTGFYYGPGGGAVFIGFPSPYYMGWHYRYYPNRYVYLNTHYHRHYHRYPHSRGGFHRSIDEYINNDGRVELRERYNERTAREPRNIDRSAAQERISNIDREKARERAGNIDRDKARERAQNIDRSKAQERAGNVDRDRARSQIDNARKQAPRSGYDRHRAYENHRSQWNNRSSRSYSRPQRSGSMGTRRRR